MDGARVNQNAATGNDLSGQLERGERTITITVAAELLGDVQGPFTWIAQSAVSTSSSTTFSLYTDYVPDGAGFNASGEIFIPFPD